MSRCKCVLCGQLISDKDFTTAVPYKGRKAHLSCFNTAMKTLKKENDSLLEEKAKEAKKRSNSPKPKVELKGAMSEEEYAEKKAYYDYLKQLVVGDLQSKTYALTESYIAKYGFTWQGLYNTLVYLNEIKQMDLKGDVVGLLPYIYSEAQEYMDSVKAVSDSNKGIDVSQMYQHQTIQIKPRPRRLKLLDIESVGGGDNEQ